MKLIAGVADRKISNTPGDVVVTHALGSCLGISLHDAQAHVGGLLHVMLPLSRINPEKAQANAFMFVDTGMPTFLREICAAGGNMKRLVVRVAGGANINGIAHDRFAIGKRNYTVLKKILWRSGLLIDAEDVGGRAARTMYLEIGSGRTWLNMAGQIKDLAAARNRAVQPSGVQRTA